ncbi:AAA ATPase [Apophysomyces ossiformis]|uniref:Cell division control protein n=1 Tax=Apophysomyces ossiformis TaxID=679940 RepID=A0A8H7EST2_9FUNG|nr:AAA ATPase [Apophysomyces ossiformis]
MASTLRRTRSQLKALQRDDASDSSDNENDHKENQPLTPSTPPTPRKRQKISPPMTPTNIRNITKELAVAQMRSPQRTAERTLYLKSATAKSNLYQSAKAVFRRTAVPSRLIARDKERQEMMDFWKKHVIGNQPGCLYISGSPGTGKTAMLSEVMRKTDDDILLLRSHQVKMIMINCMSVGEPKGIYTKLVAELAVQRTYSGDAVQQAEKLLNGKKDVLNVVVLDEIDHLITKEQDVLYKIFEWASLPSSRLVLIGIANALDLTDRILPRLRAKNCEPQLLNFNPYQVSDITAIIKDRLYSLIEDPEDPFAPSPEPTASTPLPLMQPAAVELCARKVAASMGDLRTALDVCRQAIEMAEIEYKRRSTAVLGEQKQNNHHHGASNELPKVTVAHIMKVLKTVFGNPMVSKLQQLNMQQKVILGVLMVMRRSAQGAKKDQITLGKFREQYRSLCSSDGDRGCSISAVSSTELNDLLSMTETAGIITLGKNKEDRLRKIHVNVQETEITQMVDSVPVLKSWMASVIENNTK